MSRLITQKYANEQVVEIDAMFQELWNTQQKIISMQTTDTLKSL